MLQWGRKLPKTGWASSNVEAQSAPSGWDRVNWSAKTWMGNCQPSPPISYVPACFLGLMDSQVVQKIRVHTYSKWSCQYQFQTWIQNWGTYSYILYHLNFFTYILLIKQTKLKTSVVMLYTNSNTVARKKFSFRSKTITKHEEMRSVFWRLYLNLCP